MAQQINFAQTRKIDSPEVLKALLAMPAPTPRAFRRRRGPIQHLNAYDFYGKDNEPPDDAPIVDLLDYWGRWSDNSRDPSDTVRKRLFDACLSKPELLTTYIKLLPDTDSTPRKVKDLYDKALADQQFDEDWRNTVRRCCFNSTYFLDELTAIAKEGRKTIATATSIRKRR